MNEFSFHSKALVTHNCRHISEGRIFLNGMNENISRKLRFRLLWRKQVELSKIGNMTKPDTLTHCLAKYLYYTRCGIQVFSALEF